MLQVALGLHVRVRSTDTDMESIRRSPFGAPDSHGVLGFGPPYLRDHRDSPAGEPRLAAALCHAPRCEATHWPRLCRPTERCRQGRLTSPHFRHTFGPEHQLHIPLPPLQGIPSSCANALTSQHHLLARRLVHVLSVPRTRPEQ